MKGMSTDSPCMRLLAMVTSALVAGAGCPFRAEIEVTLEILDSEGNPKALFAEGEEITFLITARNNGTVPYRAMASSTAGSDGFTLTVVLEGEESDVFAYPNPLLGVPSVGIEVCIEPGEEVTKEIVWDQSGVYSGSPVGPGSYLVECAYVTEANRASAAFAIE